MHAWEFGTQLPNGLKHPSEFGVISVATAVALERHEAVGPRWEKMGVTWLDGVGALVLRAGPEPFGPIFEFGTPGF